jgi:hypothetical protein
MIDQWQPSLGVPTAETVRDCGFCLLEIEQAQDGLGRSGRVFPSIADDRVHSKAHDELTSAGQAWRHSTRFETALHPMD